jgi:hypothetical protein
MLEKAARKATEKMDNIKKVESEQTKKLLEKRRKMTREKGESEQNTKCPEKAA